jgi:transcriptional regulator with XRE-family HTH domain
MNNEKMAKFILELRKSRKMTQKELAEKLYITDKAISKWERGLSYPDISLLSPLAEIFGITTNELLNGEKSNTHALEKDAIVETALQYADRAKQSRSKNIRTTWKIVISTASLLGIIVCAICNVAISGTFTWSLYPITSIIFAWLIIMPLFQFKKKRICISLSSFSVLIVPFLFALSKIIGSTNLLMPIGIRVSIIMVVYLWSIYILFSIMKTKKWMASAISVLLAIPVSLMINYVVAQFIGQPTTYIVGILSYGILIIVAVVLFCVEYFPIKNLSVAKDMKP